MHSKNKIEWCLKKAEKELSKGSRHRGLIPKKADIGLARAHINKAEHNLKAISEFKRIGYSDWSASAAFYSIYHCFLAILSRHGFESRNQECTFALIHEMIESGKIDLDKEIVEKIASLNLEEEHESKNISQVREIEQYGISLSLENETFERLLKMAKIILDKTKEIIES